MRFKYPVTKRCLLADGDLILSSSQQPAGPAAGAAPDGTAAGTGQVAATYGAADVDIDLGWLPEPGAGAHPGDGRQGGGV